MLGETNALTRLGEILQRASALGVDGAEVALRGADLRYTRMANSAVIQDSDVEKTTLDIRVVAGGGEGTVATNDLSPEGIELALKRARQNALATGGEGGEVDLPAGREHVEPIEAAFDAETAELSGERKVSDVERINERARSVGLLLAGSYHTGTREIALANTEGLRRYHRGTSADLRLNLLEGLAPGDSAAYAGALSVRYGDVDLDAAAERAIEQCVLGARPKPIEAGRYDVLLEPEAVAELLEWMGLIGFSSRSLEDGTSFLRDRIGARVTGERVTIYDDGPASHGHGIPLPFDGEGTPKRTIALIAEGVGRNVVHNLGSARRAGCASTGHAIRGDDGLSEVAAPTNLLMVGGDDSTDQLLNRLDAGLWITRFHYVNGKIDPRRAVMTGLTRDGTFWVEGGRPRHGVRNLRFTESILEAFARIEGVSQVLRSVPTWWSSFGAITVPALLIRDFRFTGTTDA